jgi:CBS domain-containing protein
MKNSPILRIMTPAPATVSPDSTIAVAERLMRERRCHHVPVVENGRLVGIISSHDLVKALVLRSESDPPGEGTLETGRVSDVMRRNVIALPQTATLLDAAQRLATGDFHTLPIVTPNGELTGIVTSTDLIQTLVDDLERSESSRAQHHQAVPTDVELKMLRDVFRATLNYFESGHGELEHSRLLQAVDRVRSAVTPTEVII